ncbi:MAG: hypothetical protein MH204_11400 [Fimbriimonadaceae bacterium]|nr:hypothetical protein [Fimbriimonadaceae bacterium]
MAEELEERIAGSLSRIESRLNLRLPAQTRDWIHRSPHPGQAAAGFERWIRETASATSILEQMTALPRTAELFFRILGSSSELSDALVQNPEMAGLILDPSEVGRPLDPVRIEAAARAQMKAAISFSHRLDRLRMIRQQGLIRIASADQSGLWGPEESWTALSLLADVLLPLALETVWEDFAADRGLSPDCPIGVIGMGKLGGGELNYSSDIDLILIGPDGAEETLQKHLERAAGRFLKAVSDRMSRGALWRVDMRLRPFGRSGPLVVSRESITAYLERYAEPWEHMALIRSRSICGPEGQAEWWDALRDRICFGRPRGDWQIDSILAMRGRLEGLVEGDDLKRGPGGIRDVEFAVQVRQLIHGPAYKELRGRQTRPMLARLSALGLISSEAAADLDDGCLFLRAVEHQLQVQQGSQTHRLPEAEAERETLARRLHLADRAELEARLDETRGRVRRRYLEVTAAAPRPSPREEIMAWCRSDGLAAWVDRLTDPGPVWQALLENESSLDRFLQVLSQAPALAGILARREAVTEELISGEIQEEPGRLHRFDGRTLKLRHARAAARQALGFGSFGDEWSHDIDRLIGFLCTEHGYSGGVIVLGSMASRTPGLRSDLDLVFLAEDSRQEPAAAAVVRALTDLRTENVPFETDLRLRPEGRKGALISTPDLLGRYARDRREAWERLAAVRRRLVFGDSAWDRLFLEHMVAGEPLREVRADLNRIKRRVEQERAIRSAEGFDVKLGPGGLDDVNWTLQSSWLDSPAGLPEVPALESLAARRPGELSEADARFLASWGDRLQQIRLKLQLSGVEPELASRDTMAEFEADRQRCRKLHLAAFGRLDEE